MYQSSLSCIDLHNPLTSKCYKDQNVTIEYRNKESTYSSTNWINFMLAKVEYLQSGLLSKNLGFQRISMPSNIFHSIFFEKEEVVFYSLQFIVFWTLTKLVMIFSS